MDGVEPWDAVEEILLYGNGDKLFDLFGGQAERIGLNDHAGRIEFRQRLCSGVLQLNDAKDHKHNRKRDYCPIGLQTPRNDPSHSELAFR